MALGFSGGQDLGFFPQVFVKNGKGVAVPKNVDQSGGGDWAFGFNDGLGWDLD
jgi:hypothetical protein